jgi:inner membrane protein
VTHARFALGIAETDMNKNLLLKIGAITLISLLLLVPMARIGFLIRERQAARDTVVQDIARSAAYAQTVTGPMVVVPFLRTVQQRERAPDGRELVVMKELAGELRLLPAMLEVGGQIDTSERQRGIYKARVFNADAKLSGEFQIPANFGITVDVASYRFAAPRLVLGISDIRGIGNALSLRANGQSIAFEPGTRTAILPAGVQAPLSIKAADAAQRLTFSVALTLQGTGDFQISPVGRETHVLLTSNWPHPSFVGEFLPKAREINSNGFTAEWQTSFFATNMEEALVRCNPAADSPAGCEAFQTRVFGVSFVDPVDQYLKSDRATKYAFLFIGLTFAGFFLMEVLRRIRVHPVQYGLVGLALALFFLLLIAFAEHIGFAAAYLASAAACVCVIAFYVTHVLASRTQGFAFGASLAALYGLLYGILSSEDYALLMGSLLVFGLLTLTMVLTRQVNWAGFGQAEPK